MRAPRFFNDFRLETQFHRRQQQFRPNLHVQADAPLYRVDPVITQEYQPPNEDNELVMQCFDLPAWHEIIETPDC